MEKAAKGITPEGITEEILAEAKEEAIEATSRIRQKLGQLAAVWERASVRSSASETDVMGSGFAGMYSAKFQALAKGHERVRPDKR
jgi:uncharacterized protein YukE